MDELEKIFRMPDNPLYLATTSWEGFDNAWIIGYATRSHLGLYPTYMVICISLENFSHGLVKKSGIIALHLLRKEQWNWIPRFGRQSARDVNKLTGIQIVRRATSAPIILDTAAYLETRIIQTLTPGSLTDHTCYLAEVVSWGLFNPGPILSIYDAYEHGFA